tara:strand:- start:946 stop:3402 length:2457 start_codon:yes stop_codon:yes gene_type:complete
MLNKKIISLIFLNLFLVSCGGGGSNGPVSKMPTESVLESESSNNLLPITDIKEIETQEYLNQWGLDFINASSAYVINGTGNDVTVAVVDEALDWSHHEFLKEGILHPDSILTYSNNREPTPWEKFHGTATSSIIAARKDLKDIPGNMQGIAYEAQILFIATELGDPPSDGEYVPVSIDKYDWSYYDSNESELYDGLSLKAQIVNNSFGFTGQITDYPKEVFENNFPKFINSLRRNNETIFVWSAGNYNGIIDTSGNKVDAADPGWLAGLPYYFPDLSKNNVAVVALDQNGKIASYSNRCGVASNSCIAAPGTRINVAIPNNLYTSLSESEKSGLNEGVLNYLKDHPTEAYLFASGTSFAAPHVAGSLAVLEDLFGEYLTASEILERLYNSANKEGDYAKSEIYGHGVLDLGAAVSPMGVLSFYNNTISSGNELSISNSKIRSGDSIGDSLFKGLNDSKIAVFDFFGAPFFIDINSLIVNNSDNRSLLETLKNFQKRNYFSFPNKDLLSFSSWDIITNSKGYSGFRLRDAGFFQENNNFSYAIYYGLNPSSHLFHPIYKEKLNNSFMNSNSFNIPWLDFAEDGISMSFSLKNYLKNFRFSFFSGAKREEGWVNLNSFLIPKESRSYGAFISLNKHYATFTFGFLNQKDQMLDNSYSGAFNQTGNSKTIFLSIINNFQFKKDWNLVSNFNIAHVLPKKSKSYIKEISDLYETSFDIGFLKNNIFSDSDKLAILIRQKPFAEKGKIFLQLPVGRNFVGDINFKKDFISIEPSGRNLSLEFIWTNNINSGTFSSFFGITKNKFNIRKDNLDASFIVAFRKNF